MVFYRTTVKLASVCAKSKPADANAAGVCQWDVTLNYKLVRACFAQSMLNL